MTQETAKQEDFIAHLKLLFKGCILEHEEAFKGHDNSEANRCIYNFFEKVKEHLGLRFSDCYHAYGFGNNNEYYIYKEETDENGFIVEKKIARLYYCYGIYGGISINLTDLAKKEHIGELNYAR